MGRSSSARKRFSTEQRSELLEAYRRSGLSQREFCTRRGLGLSTLGQWLRKSVQPIQARAEFIEVSPMISAPTPGGMYRVQFGNGTVVEVGTGFRAEELRVLLQLLLA